MHIFSGCFLSFDVASELSKFSELSAKQMRGCSQLVDQRFIKRVSIAETLPARVLPAEHRSE